MFKRLLKLYARRYVSTAFLTLAWFLLYPVWEIVNFYQYLDACFEARNLDIASEVVMASCPISFGCYMFVAAVFYFLLFLSIYSLMKSAQWGAWLVQGVALSLVNLVVIWMLYLYYLSSVLLLPWIADDSEGLMCGLLHWLCPLLF